jgi:hypothetical protein
MVIRAGDMQRKIMLAQSPGLLTLTRAMSNLNSVMRTSTALAQLWNLTQIASNTANKQLAEITAELAREQAILADIEARRGKDSREYSEQLEKVNILLQRQGEEGKRAFDQQVSSIFSMVSAVGILVGTLGVNILRINAVNRALIGMGAAIRGTTVSMVALSPALSVASVSTRTFAGALRGIWAALGPIGLAIMALTFIIPLLIEHWPEIVEAFQGFIDFMHGVFAPIFERIWEGIVATLTVVWEALGVAFRNLWNGMVIILNAAGGAIVRGINAVVSAVVAAINVLIDMYNSAAALIGRPGISRLAFTPLAFTPIPMATASDGFVGTVNRPTPILVGEGGQSETVRIGPGGGEGKTMIINVTVQGDVTTEERLADNTIREFERRMREKGW